MLPSEVFGMLKLSAVGLPTYRVPVTSAGFASSTMREFIDREGLGASDLKRGCGEVRNHSHRKLVARVSYNGRVWDPQGKLVLDFPEGYGLPVPAGYRNTEGH